MNHHQITNFVAFTLVLALVLFGTISWNNTYQILPVENGDEFETVKHDLFYYSFTGLDFLTGNYPEELNSIHLIHGDDRSMGHYRLSLLILVLSLFLALFIQPFLKTALASGMLLLLMLAVSVCCIIYFQDFSNLYFSFSSELTFGMGLSSTINSDILELTIWQVIFWTGAITATMNWIWVYLEKRQLKIAKASLAQ